jgi:hypothetical protein
LVDVPGTATFAAEPLNQEQAQQWSYRHIEQNRPEASLLCIEGAISSNTDGSTKSP